MKQAKTKTFIQFIALIFVGVLFLGACSLKDTSPSSDKMKVAATIFPLYDLVREVGGEKVEAVLVLPPGASPHTFEISPQKVKDLEGSQLLFTIGLNLDSWALNLINSVNDVRLIDLSTAVELQTLAGDNHEDGDLDPHYWLSPNQAKLLVNEIASQLSLLDETNSAYYLERAENFNQKIDEQKNVWQTDLNRLEKRNIIVFHDAWGYFASDFNLNIVATFEPFPGKSPSPKYLEEINKTIEQYQIKTLFVEPQLAVDVAQTLAQDLDLEIRILDPIGGLEGRDSYISLIEYNINEITR